ncbi:hypothetical protein ACFU9B_40605 [Streptomyces sp. NPDC057592]|uniref:hypothetical protein n=1 Tax=unclassified Streptomyces TaxID=2593676 RepID=UPI003679ED86
MTNTHRQNDTDHHDGSGRIRPALVQLFDLLVAMDKPRSGLAWLEMRRSQPGSASQSAAGIVGRLNRVLAVLLLDISAVRTFATALALNTPQTTHVQTAYEQIHAAWTTAGLR